VSVQFVTASLYVKQIKHPAAPCDFRFWRKDCTFMLFARGRIERRYIQ